MTSKWARWRIKSPASRLFTQPFIRAQIKENIKAPRHWSLCGEFTGAGEFPAQRASNAENVSIWWRHHGHLLVLSVLNFHTTWYTCINYCFTPATCFAGGYLITTSYPIPVLSNTIMELSKRKHLLLTYAIGWIWINSDNVWLMGWMKGASCACINPSHINVCVET